jgi:hypothetical protein
MGSFAPLLVLQGAHAKAMLLIQFVPPRASGIT